MKTILLTGATGFIGKHLLTYLRNSAAYQNWRVVLLTSAQVEGYECIVRSDYRFEPIDLIKLRIEKLDAFIHLGSFTPKSQSEANDIVKCTANITTTLDCLAALHAPLPRLLYTSTLDVYDSKIEYIQEESSANPVSLYGWSKLYTEQVIRTWAEQHNVVCQILRLGHIYGPGEEAYQKLIPHTIRLLHQNKNPVVFTDGLERRAFLHVRDCCRYIMNSLNLPTYAGPINLVSEHSISVINLIELIRELMGSHQQIEVKNVAQNKRDMTFDTTKVKELLGEAEITLREGLAQEIAEFKY